MVTAKLNFNGVGRYFEFLVDSGSDYTLISKSDALILGVDLNHLKTSLIRVELANLEFLEAYKIKLKMTLFDQELIVPVLIADTEVECLLGRKGVFDQFDIVFKERQQKLFFLKNC